MDTKVIGKYKSLIFIDDILNFMSLIIDSYSVFNILRGYFSYASSNTMVIRAYGNMLHGEYS